MVNKLLIFNEVAEKSVSGQTSKDSEKTFSQQNTPARPKEVAKDYVIPSDRELAANLTRAIATLQQTMDAASRAGLIVEPSFKSISGRFNEYGVSVDSYICNVEVYRKLS